MTEGQLLGNETVEFGRKIGRHVGIRENYITIGARIERLAARVGRRLALLGKPAVAPGAGGGVGCPISTVGYASSG
jgi:hypothetical protein